MLSKWESQTGFLRGLSYEVGDSLSIDNVSIKVIAAQNYIIIVSKTL